MALGLRAKNTKIWIHSESLRAHTGHDQSLNGNRATKARQIATNRL